MSTQSFFGRLVRGVVVASVLGFLVVGTTSCEEAFTGPTIVSLQIEPNTISVNQNTGMFDEYFNVTIQVSGFESPIDDVELFIVENDRPASKNPQRSTEIDGNTIRITRITQTWFQGMEPGVYNIGATVIDEGGTSDTQRNLAQVEVTE